MSEGTQWMKSCCSKEELHKPLVQLVISAYENTHKFTLDNKQIHSLHPIEWNERKKKRIKNWHALFAQNGVKIYTFLFQEQQLQLQQKKTQWNDFDTENKAIMRTCKTLKIQEFFRWIRIFGFYLLP